MTDQGTTTRPAIRRALGGERDAVAELIGEAFLDDPVSRWVFPDDDHRRAVHARFFGVFLDAALRDGWVDVTDDLAAAALWLPVTGAGGDGGGEGDDLGARLAEVAGNDRAGTVGELTAAVHPTAPHAYLPVIGVRSGRRGAGLGAALITHVTDRCDREGTAAYLEASSARSRALYERLGFVFSGRTVDLPGGPSMWPMWREPRG